MATSKITERDILNGIIDGTVDTDVLIEYAEKRIAQLDKRNASAKLRAERKKAETNEFTEQVYSFVTAEHQTRGQICDAMLSEGFDTTVAKVGAQLTKLAKAERISKEKGKVVDADGKSKEATLYFLA